MSGPIEAGVIAILARQAVMDPDLIRADMSPADLGLDSVGMVEVIFAIEEAFDITVPFNANRPGEGGLDPSSVGKIIAGVTQLAGAQG